MEYFDVVIVGAGPAGLKCAETLGNSKYKVLVLEKNSKLGNKICAGGIPKKVVDYLKIPKEMIDSFPEEIMFHIKNSNFKIKNDFLCTIDREKLADFQLARIKDFKNIELRTKANIQGIRENSILVDGEEINYKFLVGADGSSSIVRKNLGLKTKNMDIAVQFLIPTNKYSDFEIFFDPKLFSAWYAWIFPHNNYVSIGCGCNPKIIPSKQLVRNFNEWLEKNKIDVSKGIYEIFIINFDYCGYNFGNKFLIGDAAGLASGLTGEGIYQALISGEEVGRIILNPNYKAE
ncbi:MAG: NAD(P)/FAD-dependent oxidoreductase [Candidatus Woesearchaeota archaeon]